MRTGGPIVVVDLPAAARGLRVCVYSSWDLPENEICQEVRSPLSQGDPRSAQSLHQEASLQKGHDAGTA